MARQLYITKPCAELQAEYISFYEEWKESGEPIVPWVVDREPYDFPAYLEFLESESSEDNLPDGYVPHSTYWLVNEKRRIVGAVNIRHRLNDRLRKNSGHIGYGIRPSERRKGYATEILAQALHITSELGIEEVLVICDYDNVASEKTIRKNGGVFESECTDDDGLLIRRFWITRSS
ncbi:GNAT family N-acetyltransferase [Brevibacillus sp. MER 51]|uniref:GNAT family N-acetyltransferase n=1 Tax=Brevibacillus sp. MER 51 TaxID=2939560 RepID=UPI00203B7643|nr:GNAT family N-acetyltransferase [Brevibacillus sp. MER 51]MCM3145909.1 GNAT family N-acetyltransferase [Brevibacillus sp. MER 51]